MQDDLVIPAATLLSFLSVLTRFSGVFLFVPLPGGQAGPSPARALLCLALTFAVAPQWPAVRGDTSVSALIMLLLSEAALGLTAGLAVSFIAEAFVFSAQVLSLQAGYGYASIIDPTTQADSGILLVVAQLLAGLMFFALGVEGQILRALAESLRVYPPGSFSLTPELAGAVVKLASTVLNLGLRMALPIAGLMLLIDLSLAVLARLHAQVQLVQMSFPLKLLLCLGVLAAMLVVVRPLYESSARLVVSFTQHALLRR
ncbi:MAG TPA: flagellar biosynthetic protein FliR [Bryobacteraceae bacterium]|nr:flagellar biosynthetic protein FliR [Bryobacteraceae bacterium]